MTFNITFGFVGKMAIEASCRDQAIMAFNRMNSKEVLEMIDKGEIQVVRCEASKASKKKEKGAA